MVAKQIGKTIEQCHKEFADALIKKYGTLYAAFEESAYDVDTLKDDGFKGDWLKAFEEVAKANITIPFVDIKGYIDVTSWRPDGIGYIQNALLKAENCEYEDVEIKVKYIGAPQYMITVKAPDYKIAEEEMKKAVERVDDYIKQYDGNCEFHRKQEE
jgi:translation initiation factor 2 subunit 1